MMILYEGILDKAKDFIKNNKGKLLAAAGIAALGGGAMYAAHQAGGFDNLMNNIKNGASSGSLGNLFSSNNTQHTDNTSNTAATNAANNTQQHTGNTAATNAANNAQQHTGNTAKIVDGKEIAQKVIQQKMNPQTGTATVTDHDVQAAVNQYFDPEQFIKQHGGDVQAAINDLSSKLTGPGTDMLMPTERMAYRHEMTKLMQYVNSHKNELAMNNANQSGGLLGAIKSIF